MRKFTLVALAGILLMAPIASAQTGGQEMVTMSGTITAIDLAQGTLTLNNMTEISLPPTFQYTSLPATGQQVEVTYDLKDGHKVARSIDLDTGGDSQGK